MAWFFKLYEGGPARWIGPYETKFKAQKGRDFWKEKGIRTGVPFVVGD